MNPLKASLRFGGATAAAVALALLVSTQAAASSLDPEAAAQADVADVAAQVSAVAPDLGDTVPVTEAADGEFVSQGAVDLTAPADGDGTISLGNGDLAITLAPEASSAEGVLAQDGTLVYPADDTGVATAVQPLDSGVRIQTVLADADAATSFSYTLEGVDLAIQPDGSIALYPEGTLTSGVTATGIGFIDAPWAFDAAGAAVPTHYEVAGDTFVQIVEPPADAAYPVVADPTAWWGMYWNVSSTTANRLSALLYAGAGVAGIVSALITAGIVTAPGALATGLAAGIMAIGGAVLSYCNAAGRGIVIKKPWVGPVWCESR